MVDGTYIVSPSNCGTYYKCVGGLPITYICSSGMVFDKESQQCLPSNQGNCGNINNICAGQSKGTFLADVDSCSGYYYCDGVSSSGQHSSCPNDENFNPQTQTCDYPSDYPCSKSSPMQSICNYVPSDKYFGVSTSCGDWAICENGEYTTGTCSEGIFNTQLGVCDEDISEVKCVQVSTPQQPINNHNLQGSNCAGWATQYIKDPQSCSGFYYCNSQNIALWGQCDDNQFFSNNKCVDRSTVICDSSNICENTLNKYQWVNDPLDCHKYYYCNNNVRSSLVSTACPNNNWFNEVSQRCSPNRPTYLACVSGDTPVNPNNDNNNSGRPRPPGPN